MGKGLPIVEIKFTTSTTLLAECDAQREGVELHQRGRAAWALASGDDGPSTDEERNLMELSSNSDALALRGAAVCVVVEVVVVDLTATISI